MRSSGGNEARGRGWGDGPGNESLSKGKILISCRSHYFRTLRDQKNHFTGQERGPLAAADYRAMLLLPFSEEQVAAYLAKALPGADLQALQDTIRSVHNLTELSQRPYTLKLVARFIPQIEAWRTQGRRVNGVTLYRQLVLSWLERDSGKHQLKAEHKARFMAHLAAELWRGKHRLLPASELDNGLHAWLDSQADLRLRYRDTDKDKLEEDLRTATFLVRQDGKQEAGFRFAHSSLQEYFLAEYLLAALRESNRNAWALAVPSRETLDFLGQLLAEADDAALLAQLSQWRAPYLAEASETWLAYALRAHRQGWPLPTLAGCDMRGAKLRDWRFGIEAVDSEPSPAGEGRVRGINGRGLLSPSPQPSQEALVIPLRGGFPKRRGSRKAAPPWQRHL